MIASKISEMKRYESPDFLKNIRAFQRRHIISSGGSIFRLPLHAIYSAGTASENTTAPISQGRGLPARSSVLRMPLKGSGY